MPKNAESQKLPRALSVALWAMLAWSVVVILQWRTIESSGLGRPERYVDFYYYAFAHYELIGWFTFVVGLVLCLGAGLLDSPLRLVVGAATPSRVRLGALAVVLLLWCGTAFISHSYPLSMDEYGTLFQARIFASGQLRAAIPEAWRAFAAAATPTFVTLDPGAGTWLSEYLPVYALLRTPFVQLHLVDLLNPLLALGSVGLIADCARRLWPGRPLLPLIAAALLLSSSQFLAMSISYYSMPAHLCANLLWLSLYLRNTRRALALLPWVGGLALGLHQPVPHALFVAPFCLEIARRRRYGLATYCAAVYCGFLALWYYWHSLTAVNIDVVGRDLSMFHWPDHECMFDQTVNMTLLVSWQSVALTLGLIGGLLAVRRFSAPVWNLTLGIVLTLVCYTFYYRHQGHGWGYRYIYAVFGNLVLLATLGWSTWLETIGHPRCFRMLAASTGFALLVQIPLRAFEIEHEIRPYARTRDFLRALPEKIAVLDHQQIYYGRDLIRNDPLLVELPVLLDARTLPQAAISDLQRRGSVRWLKPSELAALTLPASAELEKQLREHADAAQ